MKAFYFDVETTGVKHWKNGIHQISGLIEIDGEIKEEFDFKVKPYKDAIIEDTALEIGKVTREQILSYHEMFEVYSDIIKMLGKYVNKFDSKDKFFLIGYNNSSFDNNFLRAFFVQLHDNYFGSWFWSNSIDVMVLAAEKLKEQRHEMENFKLHTVAKFLGISVEDDKLHDGIYDIKLTREIYKIIT